MKYKTMKRLYVATVIVYVLGSIAFTVGIIGIALHFIHKYW